VTVMVCGVPVPGGPPACPLPMSSFTVCHPVALAEVAEVVELAEVAELAAVPEAPELLELHAASKIMVSGPTTSTAGLRRALISTFLIRFRSLLVWSRRTPTGSATTLTRTSPLVRPALLGKGGREHAVRAHAVGARLDFIDQPAASQDHDSIGKDGQFLELRGDDDHRGSGGG
jgi:hypothetical protein